MVMFVLNECESIISQPRVLPFLRTSDLRWMISNYNVCFSRRVVLLVSHGWLVRSTQANKVKIKKRTQVRIIIILVKGAPKERPNHRRRLNPSKRQLQGAYHVFVRVLWERNHLGRECILVFGVLLHTRSCQSTTGKKYPIFQSMPSRSQEAATILTSTGSRSTTSSHGASCPAAQTHPVSFSPARFHQRRRTHPPIQEIVEFIFRKSMFLARIVKRILHTRQSDHPHPLPASVQWPLLQGKLTE